MPERLMNRRLPCRGLSQTARIVALGLCGLHAATCLASAPTGLRCEFLTQPEKTVIVDFTPEFCWIVNSTLQNDIQTAYRLIVASTIQNIDRNTGDVWDTGKTESNASINVEYEGKALQPGGRYYWKVMTWNRLGNPSPWSNHQVFVMYARPKTYRPKPGMYNTPPDALKRTRFSIGTTGEADKALWACDTSRYPPATTDVAPVRLVKHAEGHYFADFGRDAFAFLRLSLDSPADGQEVQVILGEHSDGKKVVAARGCVVRIATSITLKKGERTYVPPMRGRGRMPSGVDVKPFRYVEIINSPVDIDASMLTQVAYHYPFDDNAASFTSSDKTLNDVWDFCKYSIKATSFCGAYVDGDRQRDTLHGDGFVNQLCHYGVDHDYTMARYSHEILVMSQHWAAEWMMCSPLMAWYDYMYTGNTESMAKYYGVLKLKTLHGLARDDGLIGPRLYPCFVSDWASGKDFTRIMGIRDKPDRIAALERLARGGGTGDKRKPRDRELVKNWASRQLAVEQGRFRPGRLAHPEKVLAWSGNRILLNIIDHPGSQQDQYDIVDVCTAPNAMHYGALMAMRDIALALKKPEDVAFFTQRARRVKAAINAKLFDERRGIYVDGEGSTHASIHANMFPLAFGIVPESRIKTVTDYVKSRGMACSVYGAQYLLAGLYRAGAAEHALNLMRSKDIRSWAHMIYDVGSTISMEAWDVRFKGNLDWNHPWGSVPANIIPRYLMGVRPLEPGAGRILIQPQPGPLKDARARVPTIRGPVDVRFENKPGSSFLLEVTIPANVTARVGVPALGDPTPFVTLDGKRLKGIPEDGFVFLDSVGSGRHTLARTGGRATAGK